MFVVLAHIALTRAGALVLGCGWWCLMSGSSRLFCVLINSPNWSLEIIDRISSSVIVAATVSNISSGCLCLFSMLVML